jgi:hypothetical protein
MSVSYRETFIISGRRYGIEDYEEPGDHFMPDEPHQRFRLWYGGSSVGGADTIAEARNLLHTYTVSQTSAEYHGYQERMVRAQNTLAKLGGDSFGLARFQVLEKVS